MKVCNTVPAFQKVARRGKEPPPAVRSINHANIRCIRPQALGSPSGRAGSAQPRLRGPTVFVIIGTTGAKVVIPSLTVGNGLCAVPLRCEYNPCGQNGTTHRHVIPSERSESRNPPKQQVLPYVGYFCNLSRFLHSADAAVGMTMGYVSTDSPVVSGMFQAAPLPHQSGLRPASFPGGEAFVLGFGVLGFIGNSSVLQRAERHIGRSLRFR